jgi:hypothetical protein
MVDRSNDKLVDGQIIGGPNVMLKSSCMEVHLGSTASCVFVFFMEQCRSWETEAA